MDWDDVVQKVTPYVVKIATPAGHGTGFLLAYNDNRSWCGVATALHVVSEADSWQQPIKIHNHDFSKTAFLNADDRVIFTDYASDSAVIFFKSSQLELPNDLIPLRPIDTRLNIGVEVAWLGFPAIEAWTLCFFSGTVSARRDDLKAYLIDGVAINGVSGGPVINSTSTDGVQFVGVMTAYRANRAAGDSLPGLSIAQDVSHLHGVIQHVRSIDDANRKKKEIEQQKQNEPT
ncbi:MAG TPA: serine protease [Dissulfurispiraceae bacterium]|nr:serine protease [Dissulfurispiraceae bacterium]